METNFQIDAGELMKISNAMADICIENSKNCISITQKETFNGIFKDYKVILAKRDSNLAFNVFEIVSGKFYYENFHSQILKQILENEICLHAFLKLIDVSSENYNQYEIKIEYKVMHDDTLRPIDILINGQNKSGEKHCVIIESKINRAKDQDKQLHSYFEAMRKEYTVDKVVYLVPEDGMKPSENSLFGNEDLEKILKIIVGYRGIDKDLVSCLEGIELEGDYAFLLRHYIALLKQTGAGNMSYVSKKFFDEMRQSGDNEIALKLKFIVDIVNAKGFYATRLAYWEELAKERHLKNFKIEDNVYFSAKYVSEDTRFKWYLYLYSNANLDETKVCIGIEPDSDVYYEKNKGKYMKDIQEILGQKNINVSLCYDYTYKDGSHIIECIIGKYPAISGEKNAIEQLLAVDRKMKYIIGEWDKAINNIQSITSII